mmetsp:Transcript_21064/g.48716  ORF Transcript_21064/g.48716 Transcript_21064/m.48716 type:complete len:431 (-) Transcript_21064:309-1601(-)
MKVYVAKYGSDGEDGKIQIPVYDPVKLELLEEPRVEPALERALPLELDQGHGEVGGAERPLELPAGREALHAVVVKHLLLHPDDLVPLRLSLAGPRHLKPLELGAVVQLHLAARAALEPLGEQAVHESLVVLGVLLSSEALEGLPELQHAARGVRVAPLHGALIDEEAVCRREKVGHERRPPRINHRLGEECAVHPVLARGVEARHRRQHLPRARPVGRERAVVLPQGVLRDDCLCLAHCLDLFGRENGAVGPVLVLEDPRDGEVAGGRRALRDLPGRAAGEGLELVLDALDCVQVGVLEERRVAVGQAPVVRGLIAHRHLPRGGAGGAPLVRGAVHDEDGHGETCGDEGQEDVIVVLDNLAAPVAEEGARHVVPVLFVLLNTARLHPVGEIDLVGGRAASTVLGRCGKTFHNNLVGFDRRGNVSIDVGA